MTLHSHQWAMVPDSARYGLTFPYNGQLGSTTRLDLGGSNLPDIVPLTLLWKVYPIQQTGYYTTFFHGRTDGGWTSDADHFGCHPYPVGYGSGTVHNWEIAQGGGDDIVDENGNNTTVVKGQWYSQAATTRANGGSSTTIDFYWDLATSSNRIISRDTSSALYNASQTPAVVFGDAPWNPTNECMSGHLRGLQIFNSQLSLADIGALHTCETDAAVLSVCSTRSITSIWYLCMNPTPTDVTDKSGNGRNPAWANANRPELWTG
jgi:hypothetical protein